MEWNYDYTINVIGSLTCELINQLIVLDQTLLYLLIKDQ